MTHKMQHSGCHEQTFEKFTNRKGRSRRPKPKPNAKIIGRICRDIIDLAVETGNGIIPVGTFKKAVEWLKRKLRHHSKGMIMSAFNRLIKGEVFSRNHLKHRYELTALQLSG